MKYGIVRKGAAAVVVLALLPALLLGGGSAGAAASPSRVHLSYLGETPSSIAVTWDTDKGLSGYGAQVKYGTAAGSYPRSAAGNSLNYPGNTHEIHTVELTGLTADTTYYYRCGNDTYGWSAEHSFKTAPDSRKGFRFAAIADSRNPLWLFEPSENNELQVWGEMAARVHAQNPLFTVFGGDNIYDGTSESRWDQWFDRAAGLLSSGPFMVAHGNHENYAEAYFGRFAMPGNERWYSFDVANTHIVCLDTGLTNNGETALLNEQKPWLEADLQAAKDRGADWLVVFMHRPPYSTGSHGNQSDVIEVLVPVFDAYGVDIVFCGHNHFYERSFPMKAGQVTSREPFEYFEPGGTIYATTGSVGAPLKDVGTADWQAAREKTYHYAIVDVLPDRRMQVTVNRRDDGRLERFTVAKDPVPPLPDTWYFAEGTCRPGFDPYISVQNPTAASSTVSLTFMLGNGKNVIHEMTVPERSRRTLRVKDVLGEGDDPAHDFSTRLEATTGIIAERPMYFDYQWIWTGGHDVLGKTAPGRTWYFAEGCTRNVPGANFHTWLCLQNPGTKESDVTVTYMLPSGESVKETVKVAPASRETICANWTAGPGRDLSARVDASQPIVAERPVYFEYGQSGPGAEARSLTGGHCVMGADTPRKDWYFAEGTCRPGFDPYICLQNPGGSDADVQITYMPGSGANVTHTVKVPARSRYTVSVKSVLGEGDDPAHDFSTRVSSTADIVAERPMYFNYGGAWDGGHCVMGAPATSNTFFFAEGTCRPGFDPYICLQNPNGAGADVRITYMLGDGSNVEQKVKVGARSRYTVNVKEKLGEGNDDAHDFSAWVDSDRAILAERPLYFDYRPPGAAVSWTGGHCVVGYVPGD